MSRRRDSAGTLAGLHLLWLYRTAPRAPLKLLSGGGADAFTIGCSDSLHESGKRKSESRARTGETCAPAFMGAVMSVRPIVGKNAEGDPTIASPLGVFPECLLRISPVARGS